MTNSEADNVWDSSEPFENQERPQAKATRTAKKNGTDAEIVLPELEFEPEPVASAPEQGDAIDGSEDDISALEEQDETAPIEVAVDLEDRARAAAKAAVQKRSDETMATVEKKTKAEMIRDEIARRKAKGEENIRPRDILAALASKGVKVAAPQVSVALRDFDKKTPTKTAAEKPAKEPKRVAARLAAGAGKTDVGDGAPSYSALEATAAFVKANGGLANAMGLLQAYSRLLAAAN